MGKDNLTINTKMQVQLKNVNNELRILNNLHCSIKKTAKIAGKRLEKDLSNELDERELKIKKVALHMLQDMASAEFDTVVNGYLPKLQLCSLYYCFIKASDFMNLSAYAEEFNGHQNNMSAKDFFVWKDDFLKSFNPKLSKMLKPIARRAIQIVTSYTGYDFTMKSFNALYSAPNGYFNDIEVTFEFALK